ncbi:carbohydrate ABC transporter permease [Mycoplasmopsis pulmonis]|uniref:carbohydrate ABC transporter permease n=1 Tax=Mycoplasmopsis pulmonis TaxID=2107 RepID=UPI0001A23127|nr:carbohydrate ABC transporter permease [Mycoplasmopsis pulmonis]MDZ7293723.1 carbohydrate ABC transporter permease [Mycoplasmopsis pulmonis]VEU67820.1 Inner membrane ABC transporter permease protein ycjP [Mycoplasmopsis pulmonis]
MFTTKLKIQQFLSNKVKNFRREKLLKPVENESALKMIIGFVIKSLVLLFFATIIVFPFYFLIVIAFKPDIPERTNEIRTISLLLDNLKWENFSKAFQAGYFKAVFLSTLTTVFSIFAKIFFSMTLGYAFSFHKWRGKKIVWAIFLSILILPEVALLVGQYQVFVILNWRRNPTILLSLTLPFVASIFSGFMFRIAFSSIPDRIKEAAMIDGASEIKYFLKVAIPMVKPTIWTVSILTGFATWNSYVWPALIFSAKVPNPESFWRNLDVISTWLFNIGREEIDDTFDLLINVKLAGTIIAIMPMFIIYFLLRKRIMRAIGRQGSGVKG